MRIVPAFALPRILPPPDAGAGRRIEDKEQERRLRWLRYLKRLPPVTATQGLEG